MDFKIIEIDFGMDIYGFSGIAANREYGATALRLMDKMWQVVRAHDLKNKGLNIWVYEPGNLVFAGVELDHAPPDGTGLELKTISLVKYAYHKHIGPYRLLKQAGINLQNELNNRGFETCLPYIEIYGHWINDESKLETELLMSLK